MAIPTRPAFDLISTYVQLEDGPGAVPMEVGDDFWEQSDSRVDLHEGRLMCAFHNTNDWPTWEMHPAGEEIVYLLSGAIDLVLQEPDGDRIIELRNRAACIVPRGVWHRGIVRMPSDVLHITRGAGTQNRPV
jgi:mannose-6-phosphate isomerase-like protein (cupin superfamily)